MMLVMRRTVIIRSLIVIAILLGFSLFLTRCVVAQDSTPGEGRHANRRNERQFAAGRRP